MLNDDQPQEENAVTVTPVDIPDLTPKNSAVSPPPQRSVEFIKDIPITVSVELGRVRMSIEEVLHLNPGSLVTLKRQINEPIDLYINDRMIGHGEIVAVDEFFGVRVTELLDTTPED